jgi:hypothetical protein
VVDVDSLAKKLAESILAREYLETRHNTVEDDGLIGLLNLMSNVMKHNPPFKTSKEGQEFLSQVCWYSIVMLIQGRTISVLERPSYLLNFEIRRQFHICHLFGLRLHYISLCNVQFFLICDFLFFWSGC